MWSKRKTQAAHPRARLEHSIRAISGSISRSAAPKSLRRQRLQQMPQFIVHFDGVGNGVGNGGPQQFTVTLPHPVDGHFDGTLTQTEGHADFGVRLRATVALEEKVKRLEDFDLSVAMILGLKPLDGMIQHFHCPSLLEKSQWVFWFNRFGRVTFFGGLGVERNDHRAAAAFLRLLASKIVGHEVL